MKYKILKSIAYNFTHSFGSFANCFGDGFVANELKKLVRDANGEVVTISWVPRNNDLNGFSERLVKSLTDFKASFPDFIRAAGAEPEAILEFRTDIFLNPSKQIVVESHLLDDRGKEYICNVYNF